MRDILSKRAEEKKVRRNQIILGIFLIFIMFFSVAEYSFLANDNQDSNSGNPANVQKINYNGFEFSFQNGFWVLNKDGNSFIFKYNPNQVEKTGAILNGLENYLNKTIYINSEDIISESEIRVNLAQFSEIENSQNKSCDENYITIKESNESKILQEKNCVLIEGKKENLVKMTDEFLFKILGVEN
ncbi:hypothetical protein HY449_02695 [Candidatus Pacearchaeota archaeon]|nr:hypothetical protein [Candidatus Pacearchaeota archaeon]